MFQHQLMYSSVYFVVQLSAFAWGSQILEFCADNQLFSFSKEECPGGILLKRPMELTEPCHCVNKYLTAYSTCDYNTDIQNNPNNPTKVCRRFENNRGHRGSVIVRLFQPVEHAKNGTMKLRHNDSKCLAAHRKCIKIASNSATHSVTKYGQTTEASQMPHLKGNNNNNKTKTHSDTFMQRHNHHRQKRHTSITHVTDEKLRERIQETMDLLNDVQSGNVDTIKPSSMSFQLLAKTVEIFNYIAPNVIVENEVMNSILTLFLKKYADMELPGYSGHLIVDDQVTREMFENVIGSLRECASRASDSGQEFEFVTSRDTCPPNITHVVHKVNTFESGFKRVRYELGHFMPSDRKYVPEIEDFILGALWKVFDAVYSYCFSAVFSYRTTQTLHYYFSIISNIFTSPWTVNDFVAGHNQGTQMYSSRIEHENLATLMKNLDFMTEAVHILSRYKTFLDKPVATSSRQKRFPAFTFTTTTTTTSESPIFSNRNKRSIREDHGVSSNWADLEIWQGRAYCLQIANPDLPASIANALPSVEEMCATI